LWGKKENQSKVFRNNSLGKSGHPLMLRKIRYQFFHKYPMFKIGRSEDYQGEITFKFKSQRQLQNHVFPLVTTARDHIFEYESKLKCKEKIGLL